MGTIAVLPSTADVATGSTDRLAELGLTLVDGDDERSPGAMWTVADRLDGPWPDEPAVSVRLVPATTAVRPGPVAVLSPAGSATGYELQIGAALAATSRRQVEHLNARGPAGSIRGAIPAREAARAAVTGWHEQRSDRPERAVTALVPRPAIIVVPDVVGPGALGALVAGHRDADIVVVHDAVQHELGDDIAGQIFGMVEMALGVSASLGSEPEPPQPRAPRERPAFRASDVLHVRLTDSAVEVTNRTAAPITLRLTLGDRRNPDGTVVELSIATTPGESASLPLRLPPELAAVERPAAVLRHWSHGSEEVYEGGELRVLALTVALGDDPGSHEFRPGNGLDFSLTARELQALHGDTAAPQVLPEPVPVPAPRHRRDLLSALTEALAVAAGALSSARSARGS